MKIFNNEAYVTAATAKNYAAEMNRTHPKHMLPPDSPYFGTPNKMLNLEKILDADHITRAGTFDDAMLQALDKVSGTQLYASDLQQKAIIDPGSVEIHDITMAQAKADASLGIARTVLSRLVQSWRDLINTR